MGVVHVVRVVVPCVVVFWVFPVVALGVGWSISATPTRPGSPDSELSGVSCSSPSACTAVGYTANSAGHKVTLAEQWNGTSWSIQSTPIPNDGTEDSELLGVSCTSPSACTAVGYYVRSSGGVYLTLAERWDGTSWSIQPTPNGDDVGGFNELEGVSCTSANACTAVGRINRPYNAVTYLTLAEQWDGASWSIQHTPDPTGAESTVLQGVSCLSATVCTAVGAFDNSAGSWVTLAERWDGSNWSTQPIPNPTGAQSSFLESVSCMSATACTTVGNYSDSEGTALTLAESWDGTRWSIQATPNPIDVGFEYSQFLGVSCSAADACTAVGNYATAGYQMTLAEGWDGTSWSIQATPNPAGTTQSELWGVSCTSPSACSAVGDYDNPDNLGSSLTLAERYDAAGGGRISGTVSDAATHAGLASISVTVYDASGSAVGSVVSTDSNGRYTVSGLAAGSYRVGFVDGAGRYVSQFYDGHSSLASADPVSVAAGSTTPGIDAALAGAPGRISGTVTNASTHAALAGIAVTVYTSAGALVSSTTTRSNGSYTVSGLAAGSYKVAFAGTGFVTRFYNGKSSLAAADLVSVASGSTTSAVNAALAAVIDVGPPATSGVSLSGLASGHPLLRFTVAHGTNAPSLKTITIGSLVGGLGLSNKAIVKVCSGKGKHRTCHLVIKGASISGGTINSFQLSSGRLVLRMKAPSPKITVTLSTPLLKETKALQKKGQHRQAIGLKATLKATDTAGKTTTLLLKLS